MYKRRGQLRLAPIAFVTLLAASALAQSTQRAEAALDRQDAFASVHATLSDAADRALAAAMSKQAWMKSDAAKATTGTVPTTTDPIGRLRAGVERVKQLQSAVEPILREEGVPTELSAIILVESGGVPTALSPKGARGVWQFMPDTARRYGLVVSGGRDDRLDISRATHAAARYLRDLYQQYGDWQLAFAAYNAGEQAVDRALRRGGQRDFIAIQRALPQETRNYVPAVLQAITTLSGNTDVVSRAAGSSRLGGQIIYASAGDNP